jgi:type II secretory pathway component PulK
MSLRALITIMLVVALIATIVGGMFGGKSAGEMTQYVAPISSLASLALGYWFGTESKA